MVTGKRSGEKQLLAEDHAEADTVLAYGGNQTLQALRQRLPAHGERKTYAEHRSDEATNLTCPISSCCALPGHGHPPPFPLLRSP